MSYVRTSLLTRVALLAALPSLLTGCANNFFTTASSGPAISLSNIGGKLHGGQQPILGATVNLYAAGTTGYGSAGTLLATTTSDAVDSSFSFNQVATQPATLSNSYACPSGNSLIYIIGSGGNTQGTGTANNTASVVMAAIGSCTNAGNVYVNINEVTTVASVFALQQYMNPNGGTGGAATIGTASDYTIATPTQSGQGLINQFALVQKLVDLPSGMANATFTQANTGTAVVAGVTVTATPEQAKINTIANILASCLNQVSATSDTNCSTLFTNAVAPTNTATSQPTATFPKAADTLQAAYYMATNPTDGSVAALSNLYNLPVPSPPFQPKLSAQPSDWTIGVAYSSGATTCTNNGAGTGSLFIAYGYGVGIDASGNVWMANGNSATGALTEMSAFGVPQACSVPINTARGGASIDTAGNVWITSTKVASIYKFIPSSGVTVTIPVPSVGTASYNTAADGSGNLFFDNLTNTSIYELPATATATTVPTTACTVAGNGTGLAVDTKGTVFIANNTGNLAYFCPLVNSGGTAYPGTAATSFGNAGTFTSAYGIAIDGSGNAIYTNSSSTAAANTSENQLTKAVPTYAGTIPQTVTVAASSLTTTEAGGVQTARNLAVDGAGNLWVANSGQNTAGLYGISEITGNGTALSPTNMVTATTQNGGFVKPITYFAGPRAIAVDFSGNVWVTQTASSLSTSIIVEVVGAGVPVATPISAQLKTGTVGAKP